MEKEQVFPASIDFIAGYVFNALRKSARKRSLQEQLYLSNRFIFHWLYSPRGPWKLLSASGSFYSR
jgi:hypothetical protein